MAGTTSPPIRPARPADLDGLLRLYEQLSPGTGAPPRALAQASLDALLAHAFYEGHGYRAPSKGYRLYFDGS